MTPLERRTVGLLSAMYVLRIAGLMLIFPVFSLYAENLSGYSIELMGWALGGAYGLVQGLLQIPFGIASDRFGRKPVIAFGLLLFAAGSVVAALSTSMWGVILGRALQGAGAIAAPVMALLADLTREQQRTKAMAIIGITIGGSFIISVIIGPVIGHAIGVSGIFWLTAAGGLAAIALLYAAVPTPARAAVATNSSIAMSARALRDPQLARLDVGIFVVHMLFSAMFLVLPGIFVYHMELPLAQHWMVYLPVMLLGVMVMVPALSYSNCNGCARPVFNVAIGLLIVAELVLAAGYRSPVWLIAGLVIFFTGFNVLEAMLPSLISRFAPGAAKGAAIGVYSTAQFLGIAAGGALGAPIYKHMGISAVFLFAALSAAVWLVIALQAPPFKPLAASAD
jgi:predicted MFS family arabinose efflux permease